MTCTSWGLEWIIFSTEISTEISLVKKTKDLKINSDSNQLCVLIVLDLSTTFDIVDRYIPDLKMVLTYLDLVHNIFKRKNFLCMSVISHLKKCFISCLLAWILLSTLSLIFWIFPNTCSIHCKNSHHYGLWSPPSPSHVPKGNSGQCPYLILQTLSNMRKQF